MCARATTDPSAETAWRRLEAVAPLRARFSESRWRHTLSVARTAGRLAAAAGLGPEDRGRALVAALLHDVAKELPGEEQRRTAAPPEPADGIFRGLVHARAGARVASAAFGIEDPVILHAIATHPTGSPEPCAVARVLFVADYLEPTREHLEAEERALLERALAGRVPLDALFVSVLERKLHAVLARRRPVHPRSVETWNALCGEGG